MKAIRPPLFFYSPRRQWTIRVARSYTSVFMKYTGFKSAAVCLTLLLGFINVPSLDAKEIIKDEAGRVIYTIDDDGVVSMFESSPTDLTLSVTRGSREHMQPRITEVAPQTIAAGSSINLKLKGKNLVGAIVKFSTAGIEPGPYAGRPESLDVPIRVSVTVPPGEVVIQVTTPLGSTKASIKVTELQIGGASSTRREPAPNRAIPTTPPANCPDGMVGVAAERGGFCIEIDRTFSGDLRKAEKSCAMAGKRLCDASEWRQACEETKAGRLTLKNIAGEWEWTGSLGTPRMLTQAQDSSDDLRAILLGETDCQTTKLHSTWKTNAFPGRCCK
jgi:hypothetical protein